jgi:MerR family transcriptional regulator, thiopeptide resistance regulator
MLLDKPCRVQEFAALAGVTVRALHHYDRLGLLRPRRSSSGYRLYGTRELERLEQIVALKFIGIPLKQIQAMLNRGSSGLPEALRMQRTVLEEKQKLLGRAIQAIRKAEQSFAAGGRPDAAILRKIIEVIEMQNSDWSEQYYSADARAKIKERQAAWTPELQAKAQQEWLDLFSEVEAVLSEDPGSATAQALGARWKKLVGGFTGGDPEVAKGLNKMYADRPNWPEQTKEYMAPFSNPKIWEFMGRVLQCAATHPAK